MTVQSSRYTASGDLSVYAGEALAIELVILRDGVPIDPTGREGALTLWRTTNRVPILDPIAGETINGTDATHGAVKLLRYVLPGSATDLVFTKHRTDCGYQIASANADGLDYRLIGKVLPKASASLGAVTGSGEPPVVALSLETRTQRIVVDARGAPGLAIWEVLGLTVEQYRAEQAQAGADAGAEAGASAGAAAGAAAGGPAGASAGAAAGESAGAAAGADAVRPSITAANAAAMNADTKAKYAGDQGDYAKAQAQAIGDISTAVTTTTQNKNAAAASAVDAKGAADAFVADVSTSRKVRRITGFGRRSTTDGQLRWVDKLGQTFLRFDPARGWRMFLEGGTVAPRALSLSARRGVALGQATATRLRPDGSNVHHMVDRTGQVFARFDPAAGWTMRFAPRIIAANAFNAAGKISAAGVASSVPGVFRQLVDSGYTRITRTLGDGEATVSIGAYNDSEPTLVGGAVHMISDRAGAGAAAFNPPIAAEAASRRAYRWSATAADTTRNIVREAPSTAPVASRGKVYVILGIGQSNQAGQSPALTTAARALGMVKTFNGGPHLGVGLANTDVAVVADPAAYAHLIEAVAVMNEQADLATAYRLAEVDGIRSVVINTGIPNAGYASLKKGTAPFANGVNAVAAAVRILDAMGFDVEVILTVRHGEFDAGSTLGTYFGYLKEWHADYAAVILPLTGQATLPLFIAPPTGIRAGSFVPIDMERYCRDTPSAYWVSSANVAEMMDYQHWSNVGQRIIGDGPWYRAVRDYILTGTYAEMMPAGTTAQRAGVTITVPIIGATGALRLLADTDFPEVADGAKGATYTHPTQTIAISSVAISGSNIVVTLATDPGAVVAGELLRFAWAGGTTYADPDARNRPRTNIADSHPLVSRLDGRAMPKRLGPSQLTIIA